MTEAQRWLDQNYPRDGKKMIALLDIREKDLKGSLKLDGFVNLKKLNCSFNELTSLQITTGFELEEIRCQYNQLKELNLQDFAKLKLLVCNDNDLVSLKLGSKELKELNMMDNNLPDQNLSFLEPLIRLEKLLLGNWNTERVKKRLYNRFSGSLEPLKKMSWLARLDIRNTDISEGLEHLPASVVYFSCETNLRSGAKVKNFFEALSKQGRVELIDDGELLNSGFIKNFPALLKSYKKTKETKETGKKPKVDTDSSDKDKDLEIKRLREQIQQMQKEKTQLIKHLINYFGDDWKDIKQNFLQIQKERYRIETKK